MSIDPAWVSANPRVAAAARHAGLERRIAAIERGAGLQRRYDEQTGQVQTHLDSYQPLGGPSITLAIPSAGAIIYVIGEHEADRFVDGGGLFALPKVALRITGYGDTEMGSGGSGFALVPWKSGTLFTRFLAGGERTIEAVYRAEGSGNNPTYWTRFRNRRMAAGIF